MGLRVPPRNSGNYSRTEGLVKVAPHGCLRGGQVIIHPEICQLASAALVKAGEQINRDSVLVNSLIFPVMKNVAGETQPG